MEAHELSVHVTSTKDAAAAAFSQIKLEGSSASKTATRLLSAALERVTNLQGALFEAYLRYHHFADFHCVFNVSPATGAPVKVARHAHKSQRLLRRNAGAECATQWLLESHLLIKVHN